MIKSVLRNKKLIYLAILILLTIPLLLPLFHQGFFISDDGEWMIIRLSDFHRSLRDGQFPVRWAGRLNQEYGYPVFNFLYPGILYLGEALHLLGLNFTDSVKTLFGLSFIFSGIFTFLWLSQFFNKFAAFIGAICYMYAPYLSYDVYKRGSLGEALALTVIPLCLFAFQRQNVFLGSISYGLLVLTHNTIAFLATPILIIYKLILWQKEEKKQKVWQILSPLIFGLGLSAFFWIPALYDKQFTIFDQTVISNWQEHFLAWKDISLIGIPAILVWIVSLIYIRKKDKLFLLFSIVFILSLIFAMPASTVIWSIFPLSNLIQFPFRLISLTMISSAFLTAFLINKVQTKIAVIPLGIILVMVNIFMTTQLSKRVERVVRDESYYTTNEGTTNTQDEYLPIWVKDKPQGRPESKVEIIHGGGNIYNLQTNSKKTEFKITANLDSKIQINTVYFPGWQVNMDGSSINIDYSNRQGVITLSVPKGEHTVIAAFSETPIRLSSDIISLISLTFLGFTFVQRKLWKNFSI